jgi:hypothetical protein
MSDYPTNQELAWNSVVVATPLRVCKNLVNGFADSRHSMGASVNGKTPPVRVRAGGSVDCATARAWVYLFPESVGSAGTHRQTSYNAAALAPGVA